MPGRTQWIYGEASMPVLLDGAHNPDGVETLCRHLRESVRGRPRFLFAVMRDKDFPALYRNLRSLSHDITYLDLNRIFPRALTIAELRAASPALSLAARGGSLVARIRRIAGSAPSPTSFFHSRL